MQLTKHTDYGLRALMYLALHAGRRVPSAEIAGVFHMPLNHLAKVVGQMASAGIVRTYRGKGGGMTLAMRPDAIRIGSVVRLLEAELMLAHCDRPACPAVQACQLKDLLSRAQAACLGVLDDCTLGDVVRDQQPDALQPPAVAATHKEVN